MGVYKMVIYNSIVLCGMLLSSALLGMEMTPSEPFKVAHCLGGNLAEVSMANLNHDDYKSFSTKGEKGADYKFLNVKQGFVVLSGFLPSILFYTSNLGKKYSDETHKPLIQGFVDYFGRKNILTLSDENAVCYLSPQLINKMREYSTQYTDKQEYFEHYRNQLSNLERLMQIRIENDDQLQEILQQHKLGIERFDDFV